MFLATWALIGSGVVAARWASWQAVATLTPVAILAAAAKDEYEPILKTNERAAVNQQHTHETTP